MKRLFLALSYNDELTFNSFLFEVIHHLLKASFCIFLEHFGQLAAYTALPCCTKVFIPMIQSIATLKLMDKIIQATIYW